MDKEMIIGTILACVVFGSYFYTISFFEDNLGAMYGFTDLIVSILIALFGAIITIGALFLPSRISYGLSRRKLKSEK